MKKGIIKWIKVNYILYNFGLFCSNTVIEHQIFIHFPKKRTSCMYYRLQTREACNRANVNLISFVIKPGFPPN